MSYKIIVSFFLVTFSLCAQVHYDEQSLTTSGGDAVAIDGEWAVVGDADNDQSRVYRLNYAKMHNDPMDMWELHTTLSAPKTGAFGTSVAIDDDKIVVGAPDAETWRMEAGQITIGDTYVTPNFTTVNLQRTYEEPPLVFVLATNQGTDPSAVRIKNRTINSFDIIHAEPPGMDGEHAAMTVSYLAIERGEHVLPDGTSILAAEHNTTHVRYKGSFTTGETVAFDLITFSTPFNAQPMALGQIQTMENEQGTVPTTPSSPWLTTAIRNVTTNGLELSLERSEAAEDGNEVTVPETIAYLVMEAGTGFFDDINNNSIAFESIYSNDSIRGWDNGCFTVSFTQTFTSSPIVIATKNTLDGGDGGWLRQCSLNTTSIGLTVDEDTFFDSERGHTTERAGILAFSQAFSAVFKAGEAYLYDWDNSNGWQLQETIEPTTLNEDMEFGASVGIHSNEDGTVSQIAIGSPGATTPGVAVTGKVFAYSWDGTNATLNTTLSAPGVHARRFGASLDIKGDYLAVGAPDEQTPAQNDFVGASYNYAFNGTDWESNPTLNRIKRGITDERLGTNVAINSDGNVSLISGGQNPTPSFIYTNDGATWSLTHFNNFQDGGDVDIDDGIYLMANRGFFLTFYSSVLGDTDPSEPPPLTIDRVSTDQAYTSVSLYKEQVIVNEPENDQAVAIDVPCGIKPNELKAFEWAMVSMSCGDGTATIGEIFGDDLGTYGDNDNWVMYEQNGTEWSGTFASMRQLEATDTMELGKGYWIITDTDQTWKVDDPVVTTRTQLDTTIAPITGPMPTVGGYYISALPGPVSGETKKLMCGNPFPRTFKWKISWLGEVAFMIQLAQMVCMSLQGMSMIYHKPGQPYRAITAAGTPGISDEIAPYEGFWIKETALLLPPGFIAPTYEIVYPFEK